NFPTVQSGFDPNQLPPTAITTTLLVNSNITSFSSLGPVGFDFTRNLMAAIHFNTSTPDTLDLFDVTFPNAPLLLAQYNFSVNHAANANFIGQVVFSGNYVFALDANNGIMAFSISAGPLGPPVFTSQPASQRIMVGSNAVMSVTTADLATYQWQFNSTNIPG